MIYIDDNQAKSKDDVVSGFLGRGQDTPFLIPEFQRPYTWTTDQVDTLFNDIWNFSQEEGGFISDKPYFLGAFVGYYEKNPDIAAEFQSDSETRDDKQTILYIVDGQQRITTLFLLLRVIYKHLEGQKSEKAQSWCNEIAKLIWRFDKRTKKVNFQIPLLTSHVIDDSTRSVLKEILITGETRKKAEDSYSVNYCQLESLFQKKVASSSCDIEGFYEALLNQTIFLPIIASNIDTALRVFDTLNNRGLPLTDADVFKALLYGKAIKVGKQNEFISSWKDLESNAKKAGLTVQNLFTYNMFYIRGKEDQGSRRTGNPSVRKFYSQEDRLNNQNLMNNLYDISNLFKFIAREGDIPGESWCQNFEIAKRLDILRSYPNEYWKYPVVCFYLSHRNKESFEVSFLAFLKKLLSVLVKKFLDSPTVNSVKSGVLNLDIEACKTENPTFNKFELEDDEKLKDKVATPHKKLERLLLKIVGYSDSEQKELMPESFQIEHILPQNYKGITSEPEETILQNIEHLGNKLPLEQKPNVRASDSWFKLKKKEYMDSRIKVAQKLASSPFDTWTTQKIIERDTILKDVIFDFLNDKISLTDDEQAMALVKELVKSGKMTQFLKLVKEEL